MTIYAERKKIDNASEIAYNDTTVSAELDLLKNNSGNKIYSKLCTVDLAQFTNVSSGVYSCEISGFFGDNEIDYSKVISLFVQGYGGEYCFIIAQVGSRDLLILLNTTRNSIPNIKILVTYYQ